MENNAKLTISLDEKLSTGKTILLALQHVLAMDVYVVPVIIASMLSFSGHQSTMLIQSTFLAAGIATIIQTVFWMKLPVAQGPSYIPLGAIAGIYFANGAGQHGWNTMLGASLVAAIIVTILGLTGMFHKLIQTFVPNVVGGTIIFVVGLSLMPTAINENVYHAAQGTIQQNISLALISGITLIVCVIIGSYFHQKGKIFKITSVIIALFVGSIAAKFMGILDMSATSSANLISMPQIPFVDYSFSFNLSAIITMLIIYIVLLAETTGTWFAISNVIDVPLTDEHLNRGVIGEGLGCLIASLLGTTPVTGYSTNAGIISITGIASKTVFAAAGGLFVLFGFSGKLSALIATIPASVIGGVFAIICGVIALSGMQVINKVTITEKETYVISIPIVLTIALIFIPKDFVSTLPTILQYLFASPIATAAIAAMILNKIIPNVKKEA